MTEALVSGIIAVAKKHDIQLQENHVCGMFSFFFTNDRVKDYDAVAKSNIEFFNAFFHEMLSQGIYLGPSAFEAGFLSAESPVIQQPATTASALWPCLLLSPSTSSLVIIWP